MLHDAYFAGFFDGEGSVYLAQRRNATAYVLLVCVGNTSLDVLKLHQQQFGGSICKRSKIKERHRQQWQWVLSSRMAKPFLQRIRPYLVIKSFVVDLALQFIEQVSKPAAERIDYSSKRWDGRRYWTTPMARPEHRERLLLLRDQIRKANSVGVNAMRQYQVN